MKANRWRVGSVVCLVMMGGSAAAATAASSVVGRYVFYNQSYFDGNNAAAQPSIAGANNDDADAIAIDKTALLPGVPATPANYISYDKSINGIMVDISRPGNAATIAADDFVFRMGNTANPAAWSPAPAPASVTVSAGKGIGGSDRITLIWATKAIPNTRWLQVTVLVNADTGLTTSDVHYWGVAIGESKTPLSMRFLVDSKDQTDARNNRSKIAPVDFPYDYNRDGQVNPSDENVAKSNPTNSLNGLLLITPPMPCVAPLTDRVVTLSTDGISQNPSPVQVTVQGSESGVAYQLWSGQAPSGSPATSTGGDLVLTSDIIASSVTLTVQASRPPCAPVTLSQSVSIVDWAHSAVRIVIPSRTTVTDASFDPATRVLTATTNAFGGYTFAPGDTFQVTQVKGYYNEDLSPGMLRAFRIREKLSDSSIRLESVIRCPDAIPGQTAIRIYHLQGKLQREATAELLKSYLAEGLPNATVEIGTSCLSSGVGVNIHLGQSQCGATAVSFDNLDAEGYVLKGLDDTNYVIAGPTEEGTQNGAYEFLERNLGVRWVMPDSHFTSAELANIQPALVGAPADGAGKVLVRGDHVPAHTFLTLPSAEVRENPAYLTRYGSGYGYSGNAVISTHQRWSRFMRASLRVDPTHNTHHLFPRSVYGGSHPEFYPDGAVPGSDNDTDWDPNFSAVELAPEAAKRLKMYFDANSEASSFPIGNEDSGSGTRFDRSAASFAREPVAAGCTMNQMTDGASTKVAFNSVDFRDVSWSYFQWANETMAVLRGPAYGYGNSRYLGALVYHETFDAPDRMTRDGRPGFGGSNRLDSHIIPFIAFERLKLVDDRAGVGQRAQYETMLQRWSSVTTGDLGAYDYISSVLAPVVHLSEMSRYLQSDYKAGVRHNRSEHYPNWSEAFKFYAYFKLLWKPETKIFDDPNGTGLLSDWSVAAVGPEAAPYLVKFYTDWDRFWSGTDGAGAKTLNYLKNAKGSFETVCATEYLDNATVVDLLERSAQTLDSCVSAAAASNSATVDQKNRARLMRAQYSFWGMTGQARHASTMAHTEALGSQVGKAATVLVSSIAAEQNRQDIAKMWPLDNNHGNDNVMGLPGGLAKHDLTDILGKRWDRDLMFRLLAHKNDPAVTAAVASINPASYPDLTTELTISKSVWNHLCQAPAMAPLNAESGFENTNLYDENWHANAPDGITNPFSVATDPVSGSSPSKVVKIAGTSGKESYLYQRISNISNATTVDYVLSIRAYANTLPSTGAMYLQAVGRTGTTIGGDFVTASGLIQMQPVAGEWITFACPVRMPATVHNIEMFIVVRDLPGNESYSIYADDFELHRIEVAAPSIDPLSIGATSVTVSGVDGDAASVTLYKNGTQIGQAVAPNGLNSVTVSNLPLVSGDVVQAVMQSTEGIPFQTREIVVP